jgi:uncharacterized protein YggU (UPF0235/DUF167 family)
MRSDSGLWQTGTSGLTVRARVTPKSARDGVEGISQTPSGEALKVRVRAVAEKGEANAAVTRVVAHWLGLPPTRVTVSAGGKARVKTLAIDGDPIALEALLTTRLAELQEG